MRKLIPIAISMLLSASVSAVTLLCDPFKPSIPWPEIVNVSSELQFPETNFKNKPYIYKVEVAQEIDGFKVQKLEFLIDYTREKNWPRLSIPLAVSESDHKKVAFINLSDSELGKHAVLISWFKGGACGFLDVTYVLEPNANQPVWAIVH